MTRPLLLLGVDGVLNPTGASLPPGFSSAEAGGFEFSFSENHKRHLTSIAPHFEIVWATTWGSDANDSIGAALGLAHLEAVDLGGPRSGDTWKLRPVRDFAADRPLVWIDDELHPDAFAWAEERGVPTLLLRPSGSVGLRPDHFEQIWEFIESVASTPFASDFKATIGPELPGNGIWNCAFFEFGRNGQIGDSTGSNWGPPMLIHVGQADGVVEWVGQFPAGGVGDGAMRALSTPDPFGLCAINDGEAWLVDVREPQAGATPAHSNVIATLRMRSPSLLLLVGHTSITAIDARGIAWRSGHVASDDLRVESTSEGTIRCSGFVHGDDRSFVLSASTGQLLS